jgi:hypothetical protein
LIKVFKGGKYMPKVKTLLITALVIAFALSLTGCGMLLSRRAEPELAASLDGELPEWLLLSHRSEETFEEEDLLNPKDPADEEAEEDDTAIGGSDEDDGVTAPSSDQVASSEPAPSSSSSSSSDSGDSSTFETPKAGTKEYLIWWTETDGGKVSYEEWLKAKIKAAEDAEKEAELNAPMGDFGKTSPSGFGDLFKDD